MLCSQVAFSAASSRSRPAAATSSSSIVPWSVMSAARCAPARRYPPHRSGSGGRQARAAPRCRHGRCRRAAPPAQGPRRRLRIRQSTAAPHRRHKRFRLRERGYCGTDCGRPVRGRPRRRARDFRRQAVAVERISRHRPDKIGAALLQHGMQRRRNQAPGAPGIRSRNRRQRVETRRGHDPPRIHRIFIGVTQRDELVGARQIGEREGRDPMEDVNREVARPLQRFDHRGPILRLGTR